MKLPEKSRLSCLLGVWLACIWFGLLLGARAGEPPEFTLGHIPSLSLACEGHVSSTRNGVKFDVFYAGGRKTNAVIYAINTGRKQLVLTPAQHQTILADLVQRKFTVIVADFRDKQLPGIELEKYTVRLTEDARAAADGILHPSALLRPPQRPVPGVRVRQWDSLGIALRNDYRGSDDFARACAFIDAVFSSRRFELPLKEVLIIGY